MTAPLATSVTSNVTCRVIVDDPAFVACDALARPVNEALRATTPLGRRLEDAAGPTLVARLHTAEPLDVGAAVVTAAGELDARLLIHAVVMTRETRVSSAGVERAMTGVLQRATDWGLRDLVIVPFGLGAGNLDADGAAMAMVSAVRRWPRRGAEPIALTFCVESAEEADAFQRAVRMLGGPA